MHWKLPVELQWASSKARTSCKIEQSRNQLKWDPQHELYDICLFTPLRGRVRPHQASKVSYVLLVLVLVLVLVRRLSGASKCCKLRCFMNVPCILPAKKGTPPPPQLKLTVLVPPERHALLHLRCGRILTCFHSNAPRWCSLFQWVGYGSLITPMRLSWSWCSDPKEDRSIGTARGTGTWDAKHHRLGRRKTLVNHGISTTNLNWLHRRISALNSITYN